ncbi:MAG: hypothetical protein NTX52_02155, partial [Planctomycetota bacterium]|nr:hypothetical protein [Planctomycetota bacterium]
FLREEWQSQNQYNDSYQPASYPKFIHRSTLKRHIENAFPLLFLSRARSRDRPKRRHEVALAKSIQKQITGCVKSFSHILWEGKRTLKIQL